MAALYYTNLVFSAFVEGTYPVRPFLFVCFLALIMLAARFVPRIGSKVLALVALLSVALLFAVNLATETVVFRAHGIPQASLAIFLDTDEITSTRLTHDHFGKAAVSGALSPLTADADTGAALAQALPPWLIAFDALLLLIALLSSLCMAPQVIRDRHGGNRMALAVLYALCAFMAIGKAIDGGLFSDAAFLAFAAYAALALAPERLHPRIMSYAVLAYAWCVAGLYLLGAYWDIAYLLDNLEKAGIFLLVAAALSSTAFKGGKCATYVLGAAACIAIVAYAAPSIASLHQYLSAPLDSARAYAATYGDLPRGSELGSVGRLRIYRPEGAGTVGDALVRDRLALTYRPIKVADAACATLPADQAVAFTALTLEPLSSTPLREAGLVEGHFTPLGKDPSGWYRSAVSLRLNPCMPLLFDIVRETVFTAQGQRTPAIIYGLGPGSGSEVNAP